MRTLSDKQYEMMGLEASAIYDKHAALVVAAVEKGELSTLDADQINIDIGSISDKMRAGLVCAALHTLPYKLDKLNKFTRRDQYEALQKILHGAIVHHLVTGFFGVPLGKKGIGVPPSEEAIALVTKFSDARRKTDD